MVKESLSSDPISAPFHATLLLISFQGQSDGYAGGEDATGYYPGHQEELVLSLPSCSCAGVEQGGWAGAVPAVTVEDEHMLVMVSLLAVWVVEWMVGSGRLVGIVFID